MRGPAGPGPRKGAGVAGRGSGIEKEKENPYFFIFIPICPFSRKFRMVSCSFESCRVVSSSWTYFMNKEEGEGLVCRYSEVSCICHMHAFFRVSQLIQYVGKYTKHG